MDLDRQEFRILTTEVLSNESKAMIVVSWGAVEMKVIEIGEIEFEKL